MAIELTTVMEQGVMLANAGHGDLDGICLALCRRWVRSRLLNQPIEATMQLVSDPGQILVVIAQQLSRPRDRYVSGMIDKTKNTRKGMPGMFAVGGLVSRLDVIRHVLDHPAAYIYTATAVGAGHAFAFDSRNPNEIYFFDANQGGWTINGVQRQEIERWWSDFWDASRSQEGDVFGNRNYKRYFHNGTRKLTRYLVPPEA